MYRQGDILLVPATLPVTAIKQTKATSYELEHGSVTTHTHRLDGKGTRLHLDGEKKYIEVTKTAPLSHEEHATLEIAPGIYEVRKQCTWSAIDELARAVQD